MVCESLYLTHILYIGGYEVKKLESKNNKSYQINMNYRRTSYSEDEEPDQEPDQGPQVDDEEENLQEIPPQHQSNTTNQVDANSSKKCKYAKKAPINNPKCHINLLLMLRKIFQSCYILTSLQKLLLKERESRPTATIGCIQTLLPLVLERIMIIKYFIDVLKLFTHLQFKLDSYRIKATKKNRKSSLGVVASLDKFKKTLAVFEEIFTKCDGKSTQLGSEVKFGKIGFSESDVEGLCSGLFTQE